VTQTTNVKGHFNNGHWVRPYRRRIPGSRGSQSAAGLGAVIAFIAIGWAMSLGPASSVLDGPESHSSALKVPDTGRTSLTQSSLPVAAPWPTSSISNEATWDDTWLRNYRASSSDCTDMTSLWVVQPGTKTGFNQLVAGCFSRAWTQAIIAKCRSYGSALPAGVCAIRDPKAIIGSPGARGDLLIVALTNACLTRAGQDAYHGGPVHADCVVSPRE
jgi:hypothetical protein